MYNDHFLKHYADETLTDAHEFMTRERLTRHGSTLEAGAKIPNWLLVGAVVLFIGLLIIAL